MKRLKIWLIEKSNFQTYPIVAILSFTIIRNFFIDQEFKKSEDFYTPIVYFFLIIWVCYSLYYRVSVDINEKTILKRRFEEPKDFIGKCIKLCVLILFGYRTFFIFGRSGVLLTLFIITFTGLFFIYLIAKHTWKERSNHKDLVETLGQFAIISGIVGYIFFILWKNSFCYEFGVKEIGNYFEKDTYEAKYIVKISSHHGGRTYKLPADILISNDFSEYESYDTETGIGAYSYETTESSEIRYAKIKKVYLKNGESLYFKDCLVSIYNDYDCTCSDQYGIEWQIEIIKEKVK